MLYFVFCLPFFIAYLCLFVFICVCLCLLAFICVYLLFVSPFIIPFCVVQHSFRLPLFYFCISSFLLLLNSCCFFVPCLSFIIPSPFVCAFDYWLGGPIDNKFIREDVELV